MCENIFTNVKFTLLFCIILIKYVLYMKVITFSDIELTVHENFINTEMYPEKTRYLFHITCFVFYLLTLLSLLLTFLNCITNIEDMQSLTVTCRIKIKSILLSIEIVRNNNVNS